MTAEQRMVLTLNSYQDAALETDILKADNSNIRTPLLGLFGEAGSLLSALKKHQREKESFANYKAVVVEEMGDCLWYLANISSRLGIRLDDLGLAIAQEAMVSNSAEPPRSPNFDELQALAKASFILGESSFELDLFDLGAIAGTLLRLAKDGSPSELRSALQQMLRAVARASSHANISLEHSALENLEKNKSRWPKTKNYPPLFDSNFPEEDRLPRELEITFIERTHRDRTFVIQRCNGINIGDRLTDNKLNDDDYRFHDVFHMSYAVFLGWSPVLRALFKTKRKSDYKVDEVQDGARAIIIEEGISTWIFNRAAGLGYFEKIDLVDYSLLKSVRDFTSGYEVEQCHLWQWEEAILNGFRVFRELRKHRGGIVMADMINHTLTYKKIL